MPSAAAEGILGRPLAWVVVVGNGAIAVLLLGSVALAVREDASAAQLLVFATVAIAWVATTWYVAVLLLLRPRHTVEDLRSARASGDSEVVVPGSARSSVAAALAATAWGVATLSGSMVARGGWKALLVVVAVGFAAAAGDQGIAARQRRFLVLTPEALEVGSFCGSARVDWEDIASITVRQGHGGHLVFRVAARDGARSWGWLARHPLHSARRWCDVEPLSLDLDPALLGVMLLAAWEDARVRSLISATTTSAHLVNPEWATHNATSAGPTLLLRNYRPERASL